MRLPRLRFTVSRMMIAVAVFAAAFAALAGFEQSKLATILTARSYEITKWAWHYAHRLP
jgi:hypothetical protein